MGREEKHYIFMNGKRIPPHPGVTRYLVGHEYGHCVDHWMSGILYGDEGIGGLREDYRKLRGLKNPPHYGSGTWHKSPGEVFACDFRILCCGLETDFWPHDGIEYPDPDSAYGEWWKSVLGKPEDSFVKPTA